MNSDADREATAPDVDDVRRIAAIANPAIRNLEITHCYSLLAAAFAKRSGTGANWCSYATWASRQAGRTIRGEDLGDRLGRELRQGAWLRHPIRTFWRRLLRRGLLDPESRLGRLTGELHTPFDSFELAADAVARGNRKVFAEIGLEFARYLRECPPGDAARLERFLDGLQAGGATRRSAAPAPGVLALPPPRRGEGRAGPDGAGGAGEPRDRAPRADAPPAGDPRGARCPVRDDAGPRAPGADGAVPVRGALVADRRSAGRRRRRCRRCRCAAGVEQDRARGHHGVVPDPLAAGARARARRAPAGRVPRSAPASRSTRS